MILSYWLLLILLFAQGALLSAAVFLIFKFKRNSSEESKDLHLLAEYLDAQVQDHTKLTKVCDLLKTQAEKKHDTALTEFATELETFSKQTAAFVESIDESSSFNSALERLLESGENCGALLIKAVEQLKILNEQEFHATKNIEPDEVVPVTLDPDFPPGAEPVEPEEATAEVTEEATQVIETEDSENVSAADLELETDVVKAQD